MPGSPSPARRPRPVYTAASLALALAAGPMAARGTDAPAAPGARSTVWLPFAIHGPASLIPPAPTPSGPRTWHVPADLPTLRAALAVARPGDTVQAAAGTYAETGLVVPAAVTLAGDGWATTVVDGQGRGDVVTLRGGALAGFTIRGAGDGAAGIRVAQGPSAVRASAVVANPRGIVADCTDGAGCDLAVEETVVALNRGDGIDGSGAGRLVARRNTVADNAARGIAAGGGGVVEGNAVVGHAEGIVAAAPGAAPTVHEIGRAHV